MPENGFGISVATEWVENPKGTYGKQDCEPEASVRLAGKSEKDFPRLPVCIGGDGPYPNRTFFGICEKNGWEFVAGFGDGNLPSVWEEVMISEELSEENRHQTRISEGGKKTVREYAWADEIDYGCFMPNWSECIGESDGKAVGFVFASGSEADFFSVTEIIGAGRMRRKIENAGIDIRKNHGYDLGRRYPRGSVTATKNYYRRMRIAHIINRLSEPSRLSVPPPGGKMTAKHLWEYMILELRHIMTDFEIPGELSERGIRFRYD